MPRSSFTGAMLFSTWLAGCGARTIADGTTIAGSPGTGGAGATTLAGGSGGTTTSTGVGAGGSGGTGGGPDTTSIVEACVIAASCGAPAGFPLFSASTCVDDFARLGWHYGGPGWLPDPVLTARLLA